MVWQKLLIQFRATVPHLRPIRELMIAFAITGYLIYRLPISGESWDNGQCCSDVNVTLPPPPPPPTHRGAESTVQ